MSAPSRIKSNRASDTTRKAVDDRVTSLLSLPAEIIAKILSHCDVPTSLSVALVSPDFTDIAQSRFWDTVNAALPDAYGRPPDHQDQQISRAALQSGSGERMYRGTVEEKMRRIMLPGNACRMGLVRKVMMTPGEGVISELIKLLRHVAPGLRELEVKGTSHGARCWELPDGESFDYRLIATKITFHSLTHVRLTHRPLRSSTFVLLLLSLTPNLIHLDADLGEAPWGYDDALSPEVPSARTTTRLRYLRLHHDDGYEDKVSARLIVPLLEHSPYLEQVSLNCLSDQPGEASTMKALMALPRLRDLCWLITCDDFNSLYDALRSSESTAFSSLQRLVLSKDDLDELFSLPPLIPSIEKFYLASLSGEEQLTMAREDRSTTTTLLPDFAERIRSLPRLSELRHVINGGHPIDFDQLDQGRLDQPLMGTFSTLLHQHLDVMHVYLWLYVYERSDEPYGPAYVTASDERYEEYTGNDGTLHIKRFAFHYVAGGTDMCRWGHHLSDFGGIAVPIEILSKMREIQGASEAEWRGRGVEVGDEAWKLLMDWKETL